MFRALEIQIQSLASAFVTVTPFHLSFPNAICATAVTGGWRTDAVAAASSMRLNFESVPAVGERRWTWEEKEVNFKCKSDIYTKITINEII